MHLPQLKPNFCTAMEGSNLEAMANKVCAEIAQVFGNLKNDPAEIISNEISKVAKGGGKVVVIGMGREGLMMKALCMRLFHLGLDASCFGDMNCPFVGNGDLLLASAGPGGFGTVDAIIRRAKADHCRVLVITAQPNGSSSQLADAVAVVPATTMADDLSSGKVLPMGSVYEGALFVLFEIVVLRVMEKIGQTKESMRFRHTNLE